MLTDNCMSLVGIFACGRQSFLTLIPSVCCSVLSYSMHATDLSLLIFPNHISFLRLVSMYSFYSIVNRTIN